MTITHAWHQEWKGNGGCSQDQVQAESNNTEIWAELLESVHLARTLETAGFSFTRLTSFLYPSTEDFLKWINDGAALGCLWSQMSKKMCLPWGNPIMRHLSKTSIFPGL